MNNGYMEYIGYIFTKIRHYTEVKWLAGVLVSFASFLFDPAQYVALMAVFFLCITDFFLGVAAARATGEPIRSAKISRSAIKITVYFTLIAAARVTEHTLPLDFLDATVIGFLAATELISILENTGRMGFAVPQKLVDLLGDYVSGKNADNASKLIEERRNKHTKK